MAREMGFEPMGRFGRPTDFESATLSRSVTPPLCPAESTLRRGTAVIRHGIAKRLKVFHGQGLK